VDADVDENMPALRRSVMVERDVVKYGCDESGGSNLGWVIFGSRIFRCGPNQETDAVLSTASG
jgi:hypothetical protein